MRSLFRPFLSRHGTLFLNDRLLDESITHQHSPHRYRSTVELRSTAFERKDEELPDDYARWKDDPSLVLWLSLTVAPKIEASGPVMDA
jgi:hypothetical protein